MKRVLISWFRGALVWAMIPVVVWGGFPRTVCACSSTGSPTVCENCRPFNDPAADGEDNRTAADSAVVANRPCCQKRAGRSGEVDAPRSGPTRLGAEATRPGSDRDSCDAGQAKCRGCCQAAVNSAVVTSPAKPKLLEAQILASQPSTSAPALPTGSMAPASSLPDRAAALPDLDRLIAFCLLLI